MLGYQSFSYNKYFIFVTSVVFKTIKPKEKSSSFTILVLQLKKLKLNLWLTAPKGATPIQQILTINKLNLHMLLSLKMYERKQHIRVLPWYKDSLIMKVN